MYCDQYASLIPVSFVLGEVASPECPIRRGNLFSIHASWRLPFLPFIGASPKSNPQGFPLLNPHLEDAHMAPHPETLDIT